METVYTRCANCGGESHCGAARFVEMKNYDDEPASFVKLCDSCHCGNCKGEEDDF